MDALRAKKAKLETLLDDPDFYRSDPAKFGRAGVMLAEDWRSGARKSRGDILEIYYFISSSACRIGASDA
jgi:hypothetical protein